MGIKEFLETIYIGDRGCMSILIDGWNSEVKMQVTCISRVRASTWDFYTEEDLPNGFIVFEEVKSVSITPSEAMPNDAINEIWVEAMEPDGVCVVAISVDAVDESDSHTEVEIRIRARSMALEDARNPGMRIVS
ncbi:MAG: DUF6258 family protein [Ramlibacter sp.]